jgi:hypothetical protein
MRKFLFGLLILLLLSACQTAPSNAPHFAPAPAAPPGYGTLYLYRLGAPPYTGLIQIFVSHRLVLAAPEQAYTWVYVKAGEQSVLALWPPQPGWKSPPEAKVTVAEGASVYIRAEGAVNTRMPGLLTPGGTSLRSALALTPPERAPEELRACCRYMAPSESLIQ